MNTGTDSSTPVRPIEPSSPGRAVWLAVIGLVIAGVLVYINTLPNALVFDDIPWVAGNPRITSLSNLPQMLTATNRPVLEVTLAINYAISGQDTASYRVMNMAIHLLAALVLFGLTRRTLLLPKFADRFKGTAHHLAFIVALLWLVHPLNTQSVSYLIQRGESLMGLCYLFTLYSFLCFATGGCRRWALASVAACWVGMGSKEVMATAPLVVLLFDAVFVAKSWREPFLNRGLFYLGLITAWVPLIFILAALAGSGRDASAGFALEAQMLSRWTYLLSQPQIIVEVYLRKAFWPSPLVLDYGWVPAIPEDTPPEFVSGLFIRNVLWQGALLTALFLASVWATARRKAWGFLGLSFFLILAPTSSFMPIADLVFEHRMYLSLIPLVVIVVLFGHALLNKAVPDNARVVGGVLVALIAVVFGLMTFVRNTEYRSRVSIWESVVLARPDNARGWFNLASAYTDAGQGEVALDCYAKTLELRPNYADAYYGIGVTLLDDNQPDRAIGYLESAAELKPGDPASHAHLGKALLFLNRLDEAERSLRESLRLDPDYARGHDYLGLLHIAKGDPASAAAAFRSAIDADPKLFTAYQNLAAALLQSGRPGDAVGVIEGVLSRAEELSMPAPVRRDFIDRRDRYRAQALPTPASP